MSMLGGAMPGAWAYARVGTAAEAVRGALPDFVGSDGARLVFRGGLAPVGPPTGAARVSARWEVGRVSGDADVLILPVSPDLCEVHLTLQSAGSFLWRGTRLTRLAQELSRAVAAAVDRPASVRRQQRFEAPASRWVFRPASGGSSSR